MPGDTATHLAELEQTMERISRALDGDAEDYGLDDLRSDVEVMKDYLAHIEKDPNR